MRRIFMVLFSVLFLTVASSVSGGEPVFPGKDWVTRSPGEAGLSDRALSGLSEYLGGDGCVVRGGTLVYSWGDPARRQDVASAAKPVYVHFLFEALRQNRIRSLDDPVAPLEPRLNSLNPDLDHKDRRITWRHLSNQTSCYGVRERPGEAFDYSDYNIALFFDLLFCGCYKTTWARVDAEVLCPGLMDLLQCQDQPSFLAFGESDRPGRLAISPRDFARFGLLYLRGGQWAGRSLVDASLARLVTASPLPLSIPRTRGEAAEMIPDQRSIGGGNNQTDHNGSYSFAWWLNGVGRDGRRIWPDAPDDTYAALGHGGKRGVAMMPGLDLVISWNNTRIDGDSQINQAFKRLQEAVIRTDESAGKQERSEVGALGVDPDHPAWLARRGGQPFFMCGPGDPEDFLYRGTLQPDGTRQGDQMELIEKLKGTGANCLYLIAVRSHGGDGDATHNPFLDHDPSKGINPRVLDQWEQWFKELDAQGIVTFLFLYDDSARVWETGDRVEAPERTFVQTLAKRFGRHRNLIWCIAEEADEFLSPARVRALAAELRAADPLRHPIAVHKLSSLDFREFADDPNIDQFAIQYNVPTAGELHRGLLQAWREAGGRYNLNLSEAADFGTGAVARQKIWACAMGGAYVMILGMDVAHTDRRDLEDCGRLVRFFESTPFVGMAPHDELCAGATRYVLARPGEDYIVWTPDVGRVGIGLKDLRPGRYDLHWLDCATGKTCAQEGLEVQEGEQVWPVPAELGGELAVWVHRVQPSVESGSISR